jgi:hypothetical protein
MAGRKTKLFIQALSVLVSLAVMLLIVLGPYFLLLVILPWYVALVIYVGGLALVIRFFIDLLVFPGANVLARKSQEQTFSVHFAEQLRPLVHYTKVLI